MHTHIYRLIVTYMQLNMQKGLHRQQRFWLISLFPAFQDLLHNLEYGTFSGTPLNLKGAKVLAHSQSKLHFRFRYRSHACIKQATHWHDQTLASIIADACPGFNHRFFQLLFILQGFSLQSCLQGGNACIIGLKSGDWLCQSKILYFFPLMKSFVLLAVCFGSLSCCMMNFLPVRLNVFHCKLAERMFL